MAGGGAGRGPSAAQNPRTRSPSANILSHTSGLPFRLARWNSPRWTCCRCSNAVRSYAMSPLQSEPGSNTSMPTRASTRRAASSKSSAACPTKNSCDKRLFDPLGMKDTTFWPNDSATDAAGEIVQTQRGQNRTGRNHRHPTALPAQRPQPRYPMPAGGLFSTAADVARFCQMILNGGVLDGKRYLSEAAVQQMTRKQTGDLSRMATAWAGPRAATGSATAARTPPT